MNHGSTNNNRIGIACSHQRKGYMPGYYALHSVSNLHLTTPRYTFFSQRVQVIAVFTTLAAYAALYYLWHNTHNCLSCVPNLSRAGDSGLNAIEPCQIIKCVVPLSKILVYVNK